MARGMLINLFDIRWLRPYYISAFSASLVRLAYEYLLLLSMSVYILPGLSFLMRVSFGLRGAACRCYIFQKIDCLMVLSAQIIGWLLTTGIRCWSLHGAAASLFSSSFVRETVRLGTQGSCLFGEGPTLDQRVLTLQSQTLSGFP